MSKTKVAIITCAIVMFPWSLTILTGRAQTGCPPVGSFDGLNGQPSKGIQNGANATIQVVGSTLQAGDAMAQAAAGNWTKIQGATFHFTIQNVNSIQSANASASIRLLSFR